MPWNDQLIRMGNIEIAAQQFTDQIWIGVTRIEQVYAIAQLITLGQQMRHFLLALIQHVRVFAPRQQPARPGKPDRPKHQQCHQSKSLGQTLARQAGNGTT